MDSVSDYIDQLPTTQRSVAEYLDHWIMDYPGLTSKLRYGIPFYYQKSWICYLNPIKNNGIELAFTRANELSNEQGLLNFKNRKQVAGIEIFDLNQLRLMPLEEVLSEALLLDKTVPYASKRRL